MSRSKFFQLFLVASIAGIVAGSFFDFFKNIWLWLLALSGFFALFSLNRTRRLFSARQRIICLLLPLVFLIGAYYFGAYKNQYRSYLPSSDRGSVRLTGLVVKEPEVGLENQQVEFLTDVLPSESKIKNQAKILLILNRHIDIHYGDNLIIEGMIKRPNSSGDFDYASYLLMRGIVAVSYYPDVSLAEGRGGNFILSGLASLRRSFDEKIKLIFQEPHASLAAGLLLGAKKGMSAGLAESFKRTGTTHIVAISGYNITIIAIIFMGVLLASGLSRPQAFYFATAGIILFALFTGASASVVRAAIMGIVILIAQKIGRLSYSVNALLLAGILMLLANPFLFRFDIGFQLSFLATLGLIYFTPWLEAKLNKLTDRFSLRTTLVATLAAQIAVFPVLIYHFGQISVVSPLANILVLPFIPLAMLLSFMAASVSYLWLPLGKLVGWLAWSVLNYEVWIINSLARWPFSFYQVGRINLVWIILLYGMMAFFVWRRRPALLGQNIK